MTRYLGRWRVSGPPIPVGAREGAALRSPVTPPARQPLAASLFGDAQRQCVFGNCDERPLQRFSRECIRDASCHDRGWQRPTSVGRTPRAHRRREARSRPASAPRP
jgi:hypothetical protein